MFFTDAIKTLINALPTNPGTSPNAQQTNHAVHHQALHQALLGLAGWKMYLATATQSGTNAPVSTIIWNTLGGIPVWSYFSTGAYELTLAGAYPSGKVIALTGTSSSHVVGYDRISADVLRFYCRSMPGGTLSDNAMGGGPILILVAP